MTFTRILFLFAKRFVAGESLEEALPVIKQKKDEGFLTTVDILGESVRHSDKAIDMVGCYCDLIDRLKMEGLETNISIKLTQLGLDISTDFCFENVCRILDKAGEVGGYVRIDMEGSAYTSRTLELTHRCRERYPGVGVAIQSMLRRSPKDLKKLLSDGIGVRLCKGAYKELPEIAFRRKSEVDFQFSELASHLLSSGIYHGIATHDEKLIDHVKEYVARHDIKKDSFEFQMLYGIRPRFQKHLVEEGWRLRIYIPYGKSWLRYLLRRLRERKENVWFVIKNLVRR